MNPIDASDKKKLSEALLLIRAALNKASECGTFRLKEAASLNHIMDQFDGLVVVEDINSLGKTPGDFNGYIEFTNNALNRAAKKGAFTLDESYYIKLSVLLINTIINACGKITT